MEHNVNNMFDEMEAAYQRNLEKLKTFQTGDRVTKPWFYWNPINNKTQTVINGIFIAADTGTNCLVLWEGQTEPHLTAVSFIEHI